MLARNCLFIAVCLIGAGLVANTLLRRERVHGPVALSQASDGDFANSVEQLNLEFREHWKNKELEIAPPADDLTIARRLSLALVGRAPSLEEIRALEAQPKERRPAWQISHLLEDRRFADYWAERLARIYVGNEQGNIVLFRRRRFATWLGNQLADVRQLAVDRPIAQDCLSLCRTNRKK